MATCGRSPAGRIRPGIPAPAGRRWTSRRRASRAAASSPRPGPPRPPMASSCAPATARCLIDLDGDGYEQTGWVLFYLHMDRLDRAEVGTIVRAGDRVGHPSCEGGVSNGTHLHFARKYNGEWIPADGSVPFVLDGWVSGGLANEYDGTMTNGQRTIEACNCRADNQPGVAPMNPRIPYNPDRRRGSGGVRGGRLVWCDRAGRWRPCLFSCCARASATGSCPRRAPRRRGRSLPPSPRRRPPPARPEAPPDAHARAAAAHQHLAAAAVALAHGADDAGAHPLLHYPGGRHPAGPGRALWRQPHRHRGAARA